MAAVCLLLSAATASAGHYVIYDSWETPGDTSATIEYRVRAWELGTGPPLTVKGTWSHSAIVIDPDPPGGIDVTTTYVVNTTWTTAQNANYVFYRQKRTITTPPNNAWTDPVQLDVQYVP